MGSADRYADGEWNFYCDYCGRKAKSSTAVKTWENHYVCAHHKPMRNPQDFVRGVREQQSIPWARTGGGFAVLPPPGPGATLLDTSGDALLDMATSPILDIT